MAISHSTASRIRSAPVDAYVGASDHRKKIKRARFPDFEKAMLAFYRLNEGKAILTEDILLEEARTIRDAQGIREQDLDISNGWLHKFKGRHDIVV